jgi:hypothetical protein
VFVPVPDLPDDDADPIRSYVWAAAALDIDLSTFRRTILPHVPVEHISAKRRGIRESVVRAVKQQRARQPSPVA